MKVSKIDPRQLQEKNRQELLDGLHKAHLDIEKLIQRTYQNQEVLISSELRRIRSKITSMLSDVENKKMDVFVGRMGNLDAFYGSEDTLMKNLEKFLDVVENGIDSSSIDIYSIDNLIDTLEKNYNNRITVTREVLDEYMSRKAEFEETVPETPQPSKPATADTGAEQESEIKYKEFDTISLSKLYNYLNLLEKKYSRFQPEISDMGAYIGDGKWKIDHRNKGLYGQVKEGVFKTPLLFETYWHPMDQLHEAVEYVQSKANSVNDKQYLSLCLINDGWSDEIKGFANDFVHPRLSLFLYDLKNGELIFNQSLDISKYLRFWHSTDLEMKTLEENIDDLIEEVEYFTVGDLTKRFGLSDDGAARLLDGLVNKGMLIDVGLETPKYTRRRTE